MNMLIRLIVGAVILISPYIFLMVAGLWGLVQQGHFVWWATAAFITAIVGTPIIRWKSQRKTDSGRWVVPSPSHCGPAGERAWKQVEELSARVCGEDWPLDDPRRWHELLGQVFAIVAREYHPESANPLLEITVPQVAKIIELVARDVGETASERIPGSHIMTIGTLLYLRDLGRRGKPLYAVLNLIYRGIRLAEPTTALLREANEYLLRVAGTTMTDHLSRLIVDFVVRQTARYAIELYSGNAMLTMPYVTRSSMADIETADRREKVLDSEPLRILLIGQTKAGKSSLVNRLFGKLKAVVDVLPATTETTPYEFAREGIRSALIFDSKGYGDGQANGEPFKGLEKNLLDCDLVLLVCEATTASRADDRRVLDYFRSQFHAGTNRRLPPIIVVLTKVDKLKPIDEWNPPYDLAHPSSDATGKARNIADAVRVVAEELLVESGQIVPVSLLEEKYYNVEEALWPTVIKHLPDVERAKALRCLANFNEQYWNKLWRQAANTGRLLLDGVVTAAEELTPG